MKNEASSTAMLVARGVAFQSLRHPELVPDGQAWRRIAGKLPPAWWVASLERITIPGLSLHYVLRKREIERLVRDAIDDGYTSLTILGAGYDTLGERLKHVVSVTEIDHPATQRRKRTNVESIAMDFRNEVPSVSGIVVAEALFLYLPEDDVRRMLRALVPPVRLIFTFVEPRTPINFQNATWLADAYLRWKNEPMQWAIAPDDVAAFLASEGFALRALRLDRDYHAPYGGIARGEHVAVAEVTTSSTVRPTTPPR